MEGPITNRSKSATRSCTRSPAFLFFPHGSVTVTPCRIRAHDWSMQAESNLEQGRFYQTIMRGGIWV